jgi:putative hydrolase of the HAD superfamily
MQLEGLTHIAFDADDTLWGHEHIFVDAKARCLELLEPFMTPGMDLEQELYRFERENLKIFGYGVKGFVLSMIETALEISDQQISGADIKKIIELGKEMLLHPIDLLPYVREAVMTLEDHFSIMVITKGDLFDQENKLARSGLAERFPVVEIVSEKNESTYREILTRHQIDPAKFLMIGNSLRSDVLPVLAAGGRALHLPYKYTWHHEATEEKADFGYLQPASLEEAVHLIMSARG